MAVRIEGPDDISRQRISRQRGVVDIPIDPMGEVFANLGEKGRQIGARLLEQRAESQVLEADLNARSDLDQLRRKVETGQDPTQYETQFTQGAEAIIARHGQGMAPAASGLWQRRASELLTSGTIQTREGAQRRVMDDARASVRQVAETADRIIADPNSDEAARLGAVETVRLASRKAQERGMLSSDDGAQFVTAAEGRHAEVQRTAGLIAATQQVLDTIFETHDTWGERMEAILAIENPVLQDRALTDGAQRQTLENNARGELLDEAYGHIAHGRAVPRALFERLDGRDQVTLQDYQRQRAASIAAGQETPRDRPLISDLSVEAIANPSAFAQRDLLALRPRLGETAYQSLAEEQANIRNGVGRVGVSRELASGALTLAQRQLRSAGYDMSADASPNEQEEVAAFQEDLIGRLDRFHEENNGRTPTAQEQLSIVQDLLSTRRVSEGFLGIGRSDRSLTEFYVPFAQMTQQEVDRATRAVQEQGLPVTRGNVERAYANARLNAARRGQRIDR